MEHRWGERVAVRQAVELACGSAAVVTGSLENVSVSGAFVRTEGCRPARGPVEVILTAPGYDSGRVRPVRLPAYVVRESATGIGIEWCEFAPRAIRELMIRDRRSGGTPSQARARRAAGRYARGPNTASQPQGQSAQEPAARETSTLPVTGSAASEWAWGPQGRAQLRQEECRLHQGASLAGSWKVHLRSSS